jgi:RNA polymerase sigma factor (sigma-70 family)
MSTEITLIKRTLDGETAAFGQLVMQYQQQIYRLIYRIIGNVADAQDIAQEVFIKAYQNLETLKDPRCFQAWLMKIARNRCYNWIRERQDNLFSLDQEMVEYHPFASLEGRPMQFPPAPDELIIKKELYEQVMSAISELPEKDRKVIELFYLEEKSYQEIQQELGISKSVLGWRLSQARAKLRARLQEAYQGAVAFLGGNINHISKIFSAKSTSSILKVSVAKYLFISVMVHLTLFMTAPMLEDISGVSQIAGNSGEDFISVALLSSTNVDLSFSPSSLPVATKNKTTQYGITKVSPTPETIARPAGQPIYNLIQTPPLKVDNQTIASPEPLLFPSVAVMASPVNENVIENISHNKPAQLIIQRTGKSPVGQGFQSQDDSLALMDVDAQIATSSNNDISPAESELVEKPARILKGHKDSVNDIAFSSDGKIIASSSGDKTIRLWNVETGVCSILSGHKDVVWKIALSPDGIRLVSSSWEHRIWLWDVSEKKAVKVLAWRGAGDLCFSPDSKLLAAVSEGKVHIWDIRTQKEMQWLETKYCTALAFSPDGEILAVGTMMGTVELWNLAERKLLLTLVGPTTGPSHSIWSVQFSPDGRLLAASYIRENINLWDLETGRIKHSLIAFEKRGGRLAFSPDSSLLASGSNPVKLWDVATGQIVKRFKGTQPVAFSPDGKWFACGFGDNTIALWELNSVHRENLHKANLPQDESATPSKIVFISDRDAEAEVFNSIYLMDADGSNQIKLANPPENTRSVGGISVSPDGQNSSSFLFVQTFSFRKRKSLDGKKIAFHATDSSGNVDIWMMDSDGQNPKQLTFGREIDSNPNWSPDGKMIVFESGVLKQMDICIMNADGANIVNLTDNGAENLEPAWSPDGKKIAFSSDYEEREKVRNIYVMDVESKKLLKLTNNAGGKQQSKQPAWSPDGKYIAYVSGKDTAFTSYKRREWWKMRPSTLFIMDADGKNQRKLVDGAINPAWSIDGKMIIFVSDMDGDDEIYIIDSDGNRLTKLTQNNEKDSEPHQFVPASSE